MCALDTLPGYVVTENKSRGRGDRRYFWSFGLCVRKSHLGPRDVQTKYLICSTQNFCSCNLLLSSQQSVKARDARSICHPPLCQTGGNYRGSGRWGVLKDWWPPSWSHHPVKSISHSAWLIGGFCQSSAGRKSGLHPVILIGAPLMTLVYTVVLQSLCAVSLYIINMFHIQTEKNIS